MALDIEHIEDSGRYIYALLRQGQTWIDRKGGRHAITEMDVGYRLNVRRFLLQRARHLFFYYGLGEALRIGYIEETFGAPDDFDIPSVIDSMPELPHSEDYERWLRGTQLFRALDPKPAVFAVLADFNQLEAE